MIICTLCFLLAVPVCAEEFTAPSVPESGAPLMPESADSFGEGLWWMIQKALETLQPNIAQAAGTVLSVMAVALLVSLLKTLREESGTVLELAGCVAIGLILLGPSNTMVQLGTQTVQELGEYGKLLLPVMTAAMAAQGAPTSSAALFAGTAVFDAVLSTLISKLIVPIVYIFLCLAVANSAIGEESLKKLRDLAKWLATWCLKNLLYIFMGYMGITKVISGTVDAGALKAAKFTISKAIPVVGGILADASETVVIGAGLMKNAAGIYGLLAVLAVWLGPFVRIGAQYLLLKLAAAVCGIYGTKQTTTLIEDFSAAMGLLVAMTGTMCLLLLVSTVCFMKGVT